MTLSHRLSMVYPDIGYDSRLKFYARLAELNKSGVPLQKSLEIIVSRTHDRRLIMNIVAMQQALDSGASFDEAVLSHLADFGHYDQHLLIAGEQAGKLDEALSLLTRHYERLLDYRRIVIGAATGPLITIVLFLFFFSLPDLIRAGLMAYLGVTILPIGVAGGFVLLFSVLRRYAALQPPIKAFISSMAVHIPLIGSLKKDAITARFAETFAFLYDAGLPARSTIVLAARATGEPALIEAARHISDLDAATMTWTSMIASLPWLSGEFRDAVVIAEETGRLDEAARQIATSMHRSLEKRLQTMLPIITKIVTIPLLMMIFFVKLWTTAFSLITLFLEHIRAVFLQQLGG